MEKKILALAVGALVIQSAVAADDKLVEFYGKLEGSVQYVKAEGATGTGANQAARQRVSNETSWLGIRGSRTLREGLSAIYQVESGLALDNGSSGANFGTLASRVSFVGLQGSLGSIRWGNLDSSYKRALLGLDPFKGNTMAAYQGILSGGVGGNSDNDLTPRAAFFRKPANGVAYETPSMAGFSGQLMRSANEEKTSSSGNPQRDPSVTSANGMYKNDSLMLTVAYARQVDQQKSADSRDTAVAFGGYYNVTGATRVGLMAEKLKYSGGFDTTKDEAGAVVGLVIKGNSFKTSATRDVEINTVHLSLNHTTGPHILRAVYARDGGLKANGAKLTDTKAQMLALGYGYQFDKQAEVWGQVVRISNEAQSANKFGVGGLAGAGKGADPMGIAVGLRYVF